MFPDAQIDWAEVTLIGAVDAGIMAQNVLLAAESLGLGGVYIGALRNDVQKVSDVLTCRIIACLWWGCASVIPTKTRRSNRACLRKWCMPKTLVRAEC